MASSQSRTFRKDRFGETPKPTRETRALPGQHFACPRLRGTFPAHAVFLGISLALTSSVVAQTPARSVSNGKHPFTFEDMMKLKRVGAPVPSPDGKWVVFDCEDVDLEANTKISHLWIVPAQGGESRRLNQTPNHEERPRFSPDGKRLIWTSKATDPTQIWMCEFDPEAAGWMDSRIRSQISRPAPTAQSGRRMERISCLCRRYIRIARTTRAISSATKSKRKAK